VPPDVESLEPALASAFDELAEDESVVAAVLVPCWALEPPLGLALELLARPELDAAEPGLPVTCESLVPQCVVKATSAVAAATREMR
jgi:hypothetical protein